MVAVKIILIDNGELGSDNALYQVAVVDDKEATELMRSLRMSPHMGDVYEVGRYDVVSARWVGKHTHTMRGRFMTVQNVVEQAFLLTRYKDPRYNKREANSRVIDQIDDVRLLKFLATVSSSISLRRIISRLETLGESTTVRLNVVKRRSARREPMRNIKTTYVGH